MLEREERGKEENFVSRKRLNIVARSAAVISIAAAGAVAAEKTGLFDPLTNPVDSANHLVLNNLDKTYDQLIDKLPEVEKAEAAAVTSTCSTINASTWRCNNPIGNGDHIALVFTGIFLDDTCHANVFGGNPDAVGFFTAHVVENVTRCATFGGNPLPVDATICCADARPKPKSVGGIAEPPDVKELPQNIDSEKSKDKNNRLPIAAGVLAATGVLTAAGALRLYTRRNRSS